MITNAYRFDIFSKWACSLGLLLFLSLSAIAADEDLSPADEKVLELFVNCYNSNLSTVGSDRDVVISRLDEIASGQINHIGQTSLKSDDAKVVLLRLADVQTIEKLVGQYQKLDSEYSIVKIPSLLDWSCQPLIIPYLAPDFFLDEDPAKTSQMPGTQGRSGEIPTRSIYSCIITLEIIERSSEFNKETKAWGRAAKRLLLKDRVKFRWLMRMWWNENKEAFQSRNYSAVRPRDDECLNFLPSKKPAYVLPMLQRLPTRDLAEKSVVTEFTRILGEPDELRSSQDEEYEYHLDDDSKVVALFVGSKLSKISFDIPGQKEVVLYPPVGTLPYAK